MRASVVRSAIAENCSQHLDLIDEDGSGDLDSGEVETLLAAMGITGKEKQKILKASLNGQTKTSEDRVTEAILIHADIKESKLQVMLGRVALFGKVFRWLDFDGDGTLSLPEILRMMELLNIDQKLAADLMAFLDTDDSGEITWQEFVQGVCSEEFTLLFPQITLEALVELPSSLQQNKLVTPEEEKKAIKELPSIEKSLYWVLSIMYGSQRRQPTTFDLDLEIPRGVPARFKASKDVPPPDTAHTANTADTANSDSISKSNVDDLRRIAQGSRIVVVDRVSGVIVRKEAKNPQAVRPAVVYPSLPEEMWIQSVTPIEMIKSDPQSPKSPYAMSLADVPSCVVRKEARNPLAVLPAIIHPKLPQAELQWVHFPEKEVAAMKTSQAPSKSSPRNEKSSPKRVGTASNEKLQVVDLEPEEAENLQNQRKTSVSSYGHAAVAAAAALSSAFASGFSGLASAFGLPSKESKSGMSVAEAATLMKELDVKKSAKAHVLDEKKRRRLWRCRYAAILTGALAGVGAAFLAQLLNDYTSTLVDEEEDFVLWNVLAGSGLGKMKFEL
eukprot:Skav232743  [mRNA]  locus=scaffold4478:11064:12737:+ [translate_table: standard]